VSYFWRSPDSDVAQGGKARSLDLLRSLGWRTPSTEIVTDLLFRELTRAVTPAQWPAGPSDLQKIDGLAEKLRSTPFPYAFERELSEALDRIGNRVTRFSVRSSFANEDSAAGLGAGVFESRVDLAREAVAEGIRAVLISAISPGAIAYAQRASLDPFKGPFAILLHPFVAGNANGHAVRDTRGVSFMTLSGNLDAAARDAIEANLLSLPEAATPCEVEWVSAPDGPVFLQWRPYIEMPPQPAWSGLGALPETENPGDWQWDAIHNPLPLSPAQAGLVELVDERCRIGIRQRVLDGYLFYRSDLDVPAVEPIDVRAFFEELAADATVALKQPRSPPDLESAIELFVRFYQPLLGILGPATQLARHALRDFLAPLRLENLLPELLLAVPSSATRRLQLLQQFHAKPEDPQTRQALLDAIGDEASVWDVAEPTRRETLACDGLHVAVSSVVAQDNAARAERARQTVLDAVDKSKHEYFHNCLEAARHAVAVGEDDDGLYARIVAPLRHALLHLGQTLCEHGQLDSVESIFFLPLSVSRRLAEGSMDAVGISSYVSHGRAEHERFLANPPPIADADHNRRATVCGSGTGGRTIGVVFHHEHGRLDYPGNAILVAVTLLPTELPLLHPCAIVTETGGSQGHVAAQARERGLPAVVGAIGARTHLRPGTRAVVDADAGFVIPIEDTLS
jgi:phosphohistidine swiveling domain-containing protein